jgi:hypothetical protein
VTTQWYDRIEIDGEQWPLSLRGMPEPLPRPLPGGRVVEFEYPHTGLYRGYLAQWSLRGKRLYLADLEAYGRIEESGPPEIVWEEYPGGRISRRIGSQARDFGLRDVFGSDEPVWATWVTAELRVAWSRATFEHTSWKTFCARWRVLTVESGLVVGDRVERGETR